MSKLRSLSTAFWSDTWVEDLTPLEKLLFIYLVTNEKTNMLGIYEASIKKISFETGLEKETVLKALESFEKVNKVKYSKNHVILVNFMKHQNYNTNMKKSAIETYNNLPEHLKIKGLDVDKVNPSEGFERLSKGYGMVSKIEVEYEYEYETEDEEEKADDNDLIKTTEEIKQIEVVYEKFVEEVKKGYHQQWAEATYMRLKIKKGSLTELIKDFKNQLIVDSKVHANTKKLKDHLNNWLNKQNQIGNLNKYKNQKIGAL